MLPKLAVGTCKSLLCMRLLHWNGHKDTSDLITTKSASAANWIAGIALMSRMCEKGRSLKCSVRRKMTSLAWTPSLLAK